MSFMERTGSRILVGTGAGLLAGLLFGPLLLWLPVGVIGGAVWEKKR